MVKRKILGPAELALELRSNTPQSVRAFVVKEDIVNALVRSNEHQVKIFACQEDYGFRSANDIKSKMDFLAQAWVGHVRIRVTIENEERVHVKFSLRS